MEYWIQISSIAMSSSDILNIGLPTIHYLYYTAQQ